MTDNPQTTLWKPEFMKTIHQPDGGKVDMYIVRDDQEGTNLVTLGVPYNDTEIALKVCQAMNLYEPLKKKHLELLRFAGKGTTDA